MTLARYLVESVPGLGEHPRFLQPWMDELEMYRDGMALSNGAGL
jgi:hypothetical protein